MRSREETLLRNGFELWITFGRDGSLGVVTRNARIKRARFCNSRELNSVSGERNAFKTARFRTLRSVKIARRAIRDTLLSTHARIHAYSRVTLLFRFLTGSQSRRFACQDRRDLHSSKTAKIVATLIRSENKSAGRNLILFLCIRYLPFGIALSSRSCGRFHDPSPFTQA
jgi:hypothetical protein